MIDLYFLLKLNSVLRIIDLLNLHKCLFSTLSYVSMQGTMQSAFVNMSYNNHNNNNNDNNNSASCLSICRGQD